MTGRRKLVDEVTTDMNKLNKRLSMGLDIEIQPLEVGREGDGSGIEMWHPLYLSGRPCINKDLTGIASIPGSTLMQGESSDRRLSYTFPMHTRTS